MILFVLFFLAATNVNVTQAQSLAKLVKPDIGTEGSGLGCGFTFVGASYPFGMVQFTPGFFTPQRGFAINHLSGAGCAQMGIFLYYRFQENSKNHPMI